MARPGAGVIVISAIVLGSLIFVAARQAKQANMPEEQRPKQTELLDSQAKQQQEKVKEENRVISSGVGQAKDQLEQAKQEASTQDQPSAFSDPASAPVTPIR